MKKIITNTDRLKSMEGRGKAIVEAFSETFNKIKRINETTVFQGLDELDYNDIYSKTNQYNKQTAKIDDYPAEGKNLEDWLRVADTALNSKDWEKKKEARHRFLMDDDGVREYYNKLVKIKSSLDKANNGEPLEDLEKRIVRFYKSDKGNQNARIHSMARDKIEGDYIKSHDGTVNSDKTLNVIDHNTKELVNVEITGNSTVKNNSGDLSIDYPVSINGEPGILKIYDDGSHGFNLDSGEFSSLRFAKRPDFVYADARKLQDIYPKKNK